MKENYLKRLVYLGFVLMLVAYVIMIGLVVTNNIIPDFVQYMFSGAMAIIFIASILRSRLKIKKD
ncbi:hypothetical protein GC105_05540 [Alkalibaculum sp. M08DMB]|uniref:Uncharacterized protein n=1 Tax=Alkalibaculum sporogenes TaxID=2655001 RepID=A0A6A7K728_9FIRM|nr:hypothetical protein [Alkalibaculum sporogenes]MPW25250.1 hypothetical protein [Alkalibaculum sporogenes]